jgi:hypothetical protein
MVRAPGVNTAKFAAIASHTVAQAICNEAWRGVPSNSLLGFRGSLFGSAAFPVRRAGKPAEQILTVCPEKDKSDKGTAGQKNFPACREFPAAAAPSPGITAPVCAPENP